MKILKRFGIGLVCLSLIFTIGCSKSSKNATVSPSNLKTATATKQNSTSPSQATGTPATTATTTSNPTKTGPFDGGFASDQPLVYKLYAEDDAEVISATDNITLQTGEFESCGYYYACQIALQLNENDPEKTLAEQFFATTSFNYIETACPSWDNSIGNITLSIYNWKDDYATTVAGKAIKSKEFVNYTDNSWL